jgi:4-amino-4-deoxy-L-arabinose transferase-like glycosyltransferase
MGWAGTQLAALVILQTRSCYVGIAVIGLSLVLLKDFGRARQLGKLVGVGVAAMALFVAMVSTLGLDLHARVVDINPKALEEHALSIFSVGNANNRLGQDEDRVDWLAQVWEGTTANPATFLLGQGFGEPLLKDAENEGMAVREPHNSTFGVFGRLGLIGVSVWLLFLWIMLTRFIRALQDRSRLNTEVRTVTLWLFMFYILQLILSTVQPSLEFSHCALPFYFFLGLGLGITRPEARYARADSLPSA